MGPGMVPQPVTTQAPFLYLLATHPTVLLWCPAPSPGVDVCANLDFNLLPPQGPGPLPEATEAAV